MCGAGVGTVLVILMDPMWTLFGNTCNLGRTLKRQSRSSITEICLDGRFLKERCVSVFACREKEKKSLLFLDISTQSHVFFLFLFFFSVVSTI